MAAFRKFEYNLNEETQFLYLTLCLFLLYYLSVVGLPVCTLHTLSLSVGNKMAKQQRHVQSVWHKFWHHATQLHKCHTEYNRDPRSALRLMLLLVMLPHLAGL